ncbi:ferritin-like domain-containing protein [Candidatus Palauibacter sp.]|uniref:ferritin-like domain-containing protein n=1 Tax=Candidatus Palauibacter sp. TaxID=3101350 RepID=UPI003D10A374
MHAQFLANKIVSLGGKPTTAPRPVSLPDGNRAMLEAVAAAEKRAVRATRRGRGKPRRTETRGSPCSSRTSSATRATTWKRPSESSATGPRRSTGPRR